MKKNKVKGAQWYKENIKKYRFGFLFFNIVIISIVFIIFTGILNLVVEERFFYAVQSEILDLDKKIKNNNFNPIIQNIEIEDARITVAYYYTDPKDSSLEQVFNPEIIDYQTIGVLSKGDVTSKEDVIQEEIEVFEKISIGNHIYMTYVSNKWIKAKDIELNKDVVVCKVKIYMNIDGEIAARRELNTALIICTLLLLILGSCSSYLIMRKSMKPLHEFIDKQITFVSDASHELRTPLAIVQSKIENILAYPNQKVYEVSEDLAISLKELLRLNKLTTDLLALARSDKNRLTYNLTKENLNIVINEIVEPFIEIASFENRTLTYEGEDVEALIDKDKMRELIIILLDNALKYTNENDKINVLVTNGVFDAIIEVSDTGIGISEETKEKIFERFYREDKARSRETGGNGLGLSIAKTIVTDLKGKISVDHNDPKGTKFTITIPKSK